MKDNRRRKSSGAGFVIFILILCLGACVTYIVYDKVNSGEIKLDINKNEEKEDKSTVRDLSEVEKVGLLTLIKEKYNYLLGQYYPIEEVSSLSNGQLMKMGINVLRSSYKFSGSYNESFLEDEFNTYLYKVDFKHEDIICGCGSRAFIYDKNTKTYSADPAHAKHDVYDEGYVNTEVFYTSGEVKDNEVTVNAHVLYERVCKGACTVQNAYYKSYDDASKMINPVVGDSTSLVEYHINEYDYGEIKWKLPTTIYKFVISDGNYKLKSVTFK